MPPAAKGVAPLESHLEGKGLRGEGVAATVDGDAREKMAEACRRSGSTDERIFCSWHRCNNAHNHLKNFSYQGGPGGIIPPGRRRRKSTGVCPVGRAAERAKHDD